MNRSCVAPRGCLWAESVSVRSFRCGFGMSGICLAGLWREHGSDSRDRRSKPPKSKKRNKSSADVKTFLLLGTNDAVFLSRYKCQHCTLNLISEFYIRVLSAQQADSAPVFNTTPHCGKTEWTRRATLARWNTMLTALREIHL